MWYVYILECKNKDFYTGITNNLERRFKEHQQGRGGRFTRVFGARRLLYNEEFSTRPQALKREAQIKTWPRCKKKGLIKGKI